MLELVLTTIWSLWGACNPLYHDGMNTSTLELLASVRLILSAPPTLGCSPSSLPTRRATHWSPPMDLMVKANFDASYRGSPALSCSGVVLRDYLGRVLGACNRLHRHVASPSATEALAFLAVVGFARDAGFSNVTFKGDSFHVIRMFLSNEEDQFEIRFLICEGKS